MENTPTSMSQITEAIRLHEGKEFTRHEIYKLLPEIPKGTISSAFTQLKKRGIIMATDTCGSYKEINYRRDIPNELLVIPPKEPDYEVVDLDQLSIPEIEQIFLYFIENYIKLKRDSQDLKSMLQRVFGEMSKGKVIPQEYYKKKDH